MLERYHKTSSNSLATAGEPMVERKGQQIRLRAPGRLGYPSVTPPEAKSAIVSFVVKDPRPLATRLEKAKIDVKIDQPLLLLSPSVYNNQTEIDKLLNAVS
jgi:selenocysteine lyase/cysteine desulfurase